MLIKFDKVSINVSPKDILEIVSHMENKSSKEIVSSILCFNFIFLNGVALIFITDKIYLHHKKELYKLKAKEIDEKLF